MPANIRIHTKLLPEVAGKLRREEGAVVFDSGVIASLEDYDIFVSHLRLLGEQLAWREKRSTYPTPGIRKAPWWVRTLSLGKIQLITSIQVKIPGLR